MLKNLGLFVSWVAIGILSFLAMIMIMVREYPTAIILTFIVIIICHYKPVPTRKYTGDIPLNENDRRIESFKPHRNIANLMDMNLEENTFFFTRKSNPLYSKPFYIEEVESIRYEKLNEHKEAKGKLGNTIAGGLLFGPAGAIIGNASTKDKDIEKYSLTLSLSGLYEGIYTIQFDSYDNCMKVAYFLNGKEII